MTKVVLTAVIAASMVSTGAFAAGSTAAASAPASSAQGKAPQSSTSQSNSVDAALKAACQKLEPQIRESADACMKRSQADKRGQCFEQIGQTYFQGKTKECGSFFESMKAEYMAKEKQMYPTQASAMNGGNSGKNVPTSSGASSQQGMPNSSAMPNTASASSPGSQPGMQPAGAQQGSSSQQVSSASGVKMDEALKAACQKLEPKIRESADACLKRSQADKRGECFEKIGQTYFQGKAKECGGYFEPMKAEYMAKEKSMYPNQASAMNGGNSNQNQGGSSSQQGMPSSSSMPNMASSQSTSGQPGMQPTAGQRSEQNSAGVPANASQATSNQSKQSAADCSKVMTEAKKLGQECLVKASADGRRSCWEQGGEKIRKLTSGSSSCESALDGLSQEMKAAEAAKYPKQERAFN